MNTKLNKRIYMILTLKNKRIECVCVFKATAIQYHHTHGHQPICVRLISPIISYYRSKLLLLYYINYFYIQYDQNFTLRRFKKKILVNSQNRKKLFYPLSKCYIFLNASNVYNFLFYYFRVSLGG